MGIGELFIFLAAVIIVLLGINPHSGAARPASRGLNAGSR
jgi:hypothetical protein